MLRKVKNALFRAQFQIGYQIGSGGAKYEDKNGYRSPANVTSELWTNSPSNKPKNEKSNPAKIYQVMNNICINKEPTAFKTTI